MTAPDEIPLVVHKLGGSLLSLAGLPDIIRQIAGRRADRGALIVVGGGAAADLVRGWDTVHQLGDERAHWLALEAMRLNESLLHALMPELRPVRNAKQISAAVRDGVIGLLCADCFVRWGEALGHPPLPRSWDVTSDSIAAWAAKTLGAAELVLLKSAPLPPGATFEEAARAGLIDTRFAELVRPVPCVSWANVRREPLVVEPWFPPLTGGRCRNQHDRAPFSPRGRTAGEEGAHVV